MRADSGRTAAIPLHAQRWTSRRSSLPVKRVAACPPLRYNVSVVDERLQFRTLSPAAMRKVLLGGTLAEELASKITSAFTRLASKSNEPVP